MQTNVKKIETKYLKLLSLLTVAAVLFVAVQPDAAHAGTGGTEFDEVWEALKDWIEGTLGRVVAGAMILVGIVSGVARQSLMAFAVGIGGGMGLNYSPTVVESIMTATITAATKTPEFVSNTAGLISTSIGFGM
ncbi:TraA family conjugative transfer protein [Pseudovibrio sp. Ad37]|uniref:TraA family conjugative transfer protein n=1 Tax=Pseudovibrio sp. Ad37 TaxID=989422 RepID=UPI0007AEC761|nr:TraA family conjugative transfer protein [Pseudovibrio sp. Ad37]KZL22688.1 hypothetical protein PsAD37_03336 [Pseudovibrio sp. Ad37]